MRTERTTGPLRLSSDDLDKILGILDKIDQGLSPPRFPDRIGRFLRQYGTGRAHLDQILTKNNIERRADGAISGQALQRIEIHPITQPTVRVRGFPLGEVADSLAFSEELGGLTNITMWLKGPIANASYNLLRMNTGLRLSGDYRWTPPARFTPGEAHVEASEIQTKWQHAKCLKAVADDIARPPHALEYVLDYHMGPPGIKYFRCVCAVRRGPTWRILPGLTEPMDLEVAQTLPESRRNLADVELATLLIYREPWSEAWTIVDGDIIDAHGALSHAVTWADSQKEVDGGAMDAEIVSGIRQSLHLAGLRPAEFTGANLTRRLLPAARDVIRWLRGWAGE